MWIFLALLSGSFAALFAIMIKAHLKNMNSFFLIFLFSLISLLSLIIFDLVTNKVNCKLVTTLTSKEWLVLVIAAILNGLALICYVSALKCGKTGGVVAIDRLGIIYVVLLSAVFLQETFSIKTIIGAITMVVGAVLISIK